MTHTPRALRMEITVRKNENFVAVWNTIIDDVKVGRGNKKECEALADELRGDKSKADLVLSLFSKNVTDGERKGGNRHGSNHLKSRTTGESKEAPGVQREPRN